jgi:membrane protein involved in colicin uptake
MIEFPSSASFSFIILSTTLLFILTYYFVFSGFGITIDCGGSGGGNGSVGLRFWSLLS